ncbi:MAG: hypothetical protein HFI51_04405 [Lachnospiraceae bacterium]|jgi:hypothetical protein|nr:hypothetical protein [Lachnospiraceae bacterium]
MNKQEKKRLEQLAVMKMETTPYTLINDSVAHRAGYIRALLDLQIIDNLSAARMLINIENMEW